MTDLKSLKDVQNYLSQLQKHLEQETKEKEEQAKHIEELQQQLEQVTKGKNEQVKLLAKCQHEKMMMNKELVRVEAQIELLKSLLLRDNPIEL